MINIKLAVFNMPFEPADNPITDLTHEKFMKEIMLIIDPHGEQEPVFAIKTKNYSIHRVRCVDYDEHDLKIINNCFRALHKDPMNEFAVEGIVEKAEKIFPKYAKNAEKIVMLSRPFFNIHSDPRTLFKND